MHISCGRARPQLLSEKYRCFLSAVHFQFFAFELWTLQKQLCLVFVKLNTANLQKSTYLAFCHSAYDTVIRVVWDGDTKKQAGRCCHLAVAVVIALCNNSLNCVPSLEFVHLAQTDR